MSAWNYSSLKTALRKLTVPDVWEMLGLPGIPKTSCRSPLRDNDRNASFSIYDGGRRWKDHGTGEAGDAVVFLAKHLGLSNGEACKRLIKMAGILPIPKTPEQRIAARFHNAEVEEIALAEEKALKRSQWPIFEIPTAIEIRTIAASRDLSEDSAEIAVQRGLLFCADSQEGRAWILSDSRRINAQARRLDGRPWKRINSKKAWTLPGSIANWPIGLIEAKSYPAIALVEGGPDLLAALHLAWCSSAIPKTLAKGKGLDLVANLAVVAILGAGIRIPQGALPYFAGKRIRVFQDDDTSRRCAAARWANQLATPGVNVDGFSFLHGIHAGGRRSRRRI